MQMDTRPRAIFFEESLILSSPVFFSSSAKEGDADVHAVRCPRAN
jgi:hypothetical protein